MRQSLSPEEIRAEFARAWNLPGNRSSRIQREWEDGWASIVTLVDSPWDVTDMRESEVERLDDIDGRVLEDLAHLKADVERQIIERLVAAAITFAREVPDTPRREGASA